MKKIKGDLLSLILKGNYEEKKGIIIKFLLSCVKILSTALCMQVWIFMIYAIFLPKQEKGNKLLYRKSRSRMTAAFGCRITAGDLQRPEPCPRHCQCTW